MSGSSSPSYEAALCARMCQALYRSDQYEPWRVLEHACEEIDNPRLITKILLAARPLIPEFDEEELELIHELAERALSYGPPELGAYAPTREPDMDAYTKLPPGKDPRKKNSSRDNDTDHEGSSDFWEDIYGMQREMEEMANKVIKKYPPQGAGGGQGTPSSGPTNKPVHKPNAIKPPNPPSLPTPARTPTREKSSGWGWLLGLLAVGGAAVALSGDEDDE